MRPHCPKPQNPKTPRYCHKVIWNNTVLTSAAEVATVAAATVAGTQIASTVAKALRPGMDCMKCCGRAVVGAGSLATTAAAITEGAGSSSFAAIAAEAAAVVWQLGCQSVVG